MERPSIYEYRNYRHFLRDIFAYKKKMGRYSLRDFARAADLKSPGLLKMIIEGERNLSPKTVISFARAFDLSAEESEFFEALVFYNQATGQPEREAYFNKLQQHPGFQKSGALEKDQYDVFSDWYHIAIRELVTLKDFKNDPQWIAERLDPPIRPKEAKESLKKLIKLRFLKKGSRGKLLQTNPTETTPASVLSLALSKFHRQICDITKSAIDTTPSTERHISGLTLGVTKEELKEINQDLEDFRQTLLKKYGNRKRKPEEVYHLSTYFIPLSKK